MSTINQLLTSLKPDPGKIFFKPEWYQNLWRLLEALASGQHLANSPTVKVTSRQAGEVKLKSAPAPIGQSSSATLRKLPFELVVPTSSDVFAIPEGGLLPAHFLVWDGVLRSNLPSDASKDVIPFTDVDNEAVSLDTRPLFTATSDWQRVYLRVEIDVTASELQPKEDPADPDVYEPTEADTVAIDEEEEGDLGGGWQIQLLADEDPQDATITTFNTTDATSTVGVYYVLLGKLRLPEGTSQLQIWQPRVGSLQFTYCLQNFELIVNEANYVGQVAYAP